MRKIKHGQLVKLGTHLLACGDATDTPIIRKLVGGRKISLILTDPPYGVAYVENKPEFTRPSRHKKIINDQAQTEQHYQAFSRQWLQSISPSLTQKNACYIFNSDKMLFALRNGMQDAGYRFGQLLIWLKTQSVIGRLDYLPQHELIVYGWHGRHQFFKSKDKSIIICPRTAHNDLHPTMKPVSLLRRLILNSSKIGDYVYDPFGGSGSTLIACEQTKRKCLMIELEPDYCLKIINRFEKLTKLKAELIV